MYSTQTTFHNRNQVMSFSIQLCPSSVNCLRSLEFAQPIFLASITSLSVLWIKELIFSLFRLIYCQTRPNLESNLFGSLQDLYLQVGPWSGYISFWNHPPTRHQSFENTVSQLLLTASLGPKWNPTCLDSCNTWICKLGNEVAILPPGHPATQPTDHLNV